MGGFVLVKEILTMGYFTITKNSYDIRWYVQHMLHVKALYDAYHTYVQYGVAQSHKYKMLIRFSCNFCEMKMDLNKLMYQNINLTKYKS